jgi:lysophospholipase L1-like esterase
MLSLFLILLAALLVYIAYQGIRVMRLMRIGRTLSAQTRAYKREHGEISLLAIGDSTVVGVGAENPKDSLPGRCSSLLNASVENYAKSGAVVSDLLSQLAQAKRARYDLILVQIGGNDVIRLRSLTRTQKVLDDSLCAISARSTRVVLLLAGRIGKAPLFPRFIIGPLLISRAAALRARFIESAERRGVLYVDLLLPSKVFNTDPERYYAKDMLHLSGDGYGVWFAAVKDGITRRWPDLLPAR